jgi:hypothetical protein
MRTSLRSFAVCLAVSGVVAVLPHAGAAADVDAAKRYIASYYTESGCQQAARKGRSEGRWTKHTCVKTIFYRIGTWDLWVE